MIAKSEKDDPPGISLRPPSLRRAIVVTTGALSLTALLLFPTISRFAPAPAPSRSAIPKETPPSARIAISRSRLRSLSPPRRRPARPIRSYASLMRSAVFRPLVEFAPRSEAEETVQPIGSLLPASVEGLYLHSGPASPLSGWRYIGSATVGGDAFALLQETDSEGTGYYRVGESVEGAPIRSIQPDMLILGLPGQPAIRMPKTGGATVPPGSDASPPNPQTAPNRASSALSSPFAAPARIAKTAPRNSGRNEVAERLNFIKNSEFEIKINSKRIHSETVSPGSTDRINDQPFAK